MASHLSPADFAARSWRVEGINTVAERSGSGRWALKMRYHASATHTKKLSKDWARSSDDR